jgi:cation transport ATPase
MKNVFILVCLTTLIACDTSPKKISLNFLISGMSCSRSCSPYIEKKLNQLDGVLEATVSFQKKSAEITIDIEKISSKDVIREIETIAGGQYKVEEVSKKDFEKKNKEDALLEESSLKFDIINSKVSHSTGFQLPNIFSLLNSLIR